MATMRFYKIWRWLSFFFTGFFAVLATSAFIDGHGERGLVLVEATLVQLAIILYASAQIKVEEQRQYIERIHAKYEAAIRATADPVKVSYYINNNLPEYRGGENPTPTRPTRGR